ncbi:FAD-dependent oxidoreductase [Saxibacter everestensis]|uniref:FAD-dependent oxidoreductase n=1 Tax=Saxibacter everestensis TaxID=2909229 RepID=A0ABY8QX51_9MICO|nr:FAD-dependent oxidoreductase [Brevibacteriaceae bacterium ZFBP1038]
MHTARTNYPDALSPIAIGNVSVRNRIFSSAHQTGLVHDHLPTEDLLAYHRERARGGIGAIFMEASATHPSGLLTPHTIGAYLPESIRPMSEIADAVHREGAKLFVQLFHGGREQIATAPKQPAVAPSAVPSARFHVEPRALTGTEIFELVTGYRQAASHVAQAGLDGAEVSASHAYLPAQFFAKRSNHRTDDYGGSLRNRLRFVMDVLNATREGLGPDKALGVRLAIDEISPDALDRNACIEIAGLLAEETPIDFVSFVLGDSATYVGSSFIAPPPLTAPDGIVGSLAGLRGVVPDRVRLLGTTRFLELAQADSAVSDGLLDLVGMTRAHIADPHLVRKASAGAAPIPCIGCNVCIGHYHAGTPIACATNISTGRELTRSQPPESVPSVSVESVAVVGAGPAGVAVSQGSVAAVDSPRGTIAVVGAGPAGVAAAVQAARRGASVTLFERESEIGGQLRVAGGAPDHRETWARWKGWADRELAEFNVDLRLETEVTAAELEGFDRVTVATGARPYQDEEVWRAAADQSMPMLDSWQLLATPDVAELPGPVLVADWGGDPSGLDATEVLAAAGQHVYYAYAGPAPTEFIHQYQRNGYLGRLDQENVTLLPHLELATEGGQLVLRNVFSGRSRALPGDIRSIVAAHGRVPETELAGQFPVGALVGDAAGPRSLEEATLEGTMAVEAR